MNIGAEIAVSILNTTISVGLPLVSCFNFPRCSCHTTYLFAKDTCQFGSWQTGHHRRLGEDVYIEHTSAWDVASGCTVDQLGSLSAQLRLNGRTGVPQFNWGSMDVRRRRRQGCLSRLWWCAFVHPREWHLLTGHKFNVYLINYLYD